MDKKKRTYYVSSTNCDCASDITVTTSDPRKNMYGPRCPNCHRVLGCMQWNFICTVSAIGQMDAYQKYQKIKNNRR